MSVPSTQAPPPWPVGSGRDGDPVDELRHGETVSGFVLQAGEQGVGARVTEVEGDPVDAGLQVVPLGPGSIWMSAKPAPRSTRGQSIRFLASSRSSSGTFGFQLVSTSRRPGRRIRRASTAAAAGSPAKWNASIDTAASGLACGSPVWARSPTTNRARPASPNSAAGVRPDRPRQVRNPPLPTRQPPAARATAPGRRVRIPDPRVSVLATGPGPAPVAQQTDRDEGERHDLRRQVRLGQLPDPPDPRGGHCCRKYLMEVGGRQRGRAGSGREIIVLRHRSSPGHPRVHESLSPSTSEGESGRPVPGQQADSAGRDHYQADRQGDRGRPADEHR